MGQKGMINIKQKEESVMVEKLEVKSNNVAL